MHTSELRALSLPSCLILLGSSLRGQSSSELEIGAGFAREGSMATIPLRPTTTDEVQGLVMVFEWDGDVRFPPRQGPGFDRMVKVSPQGPDPTEDKLGLEGGGEC
jgi:hypothetical protein